MQAKETPEEVFEGLLSAWAAQREIYYGEFGDSFSKEEEQELADHMAEWRERWRKATSANE